MTTRRLLAPAASSLVAIALVASAASSPASARPATERSDARCAQSGPISLSAASAASRAGCSLAGRVVTDGRVSMTVPPAGMSVAGDGTTRHGDLAGFRVTNTGHGIRVVAEGRRDRWWGQLVPRPLEQYDDLDHPHDPDHPDHADQHHEHHQLDGHDQHDRPDDHGSSR